MDSCELWGSRVCLSFSKQESLPHISIKLFIALPRFVAFEHCNKHFQQTMKSGGTLVCCLTWLILSALWIGPVVGAAQHFEPNKNVAMLDRDGGATDSVSARCFSGVCVWWDACLAVVFVCLCVVEVIWSKQLLVLFCC